MISKPKVVKEKKPVAALVQPAPTGMNAPAPTTGIAAPSSPQLSPAPVPNPVPSNPVPATGSGEEGGGIMRGAELENTLKEMQDMGFPRDECMRALRAAFYNPDRAVDYLLNGIPADLQQDQPQPARYSAGAGAATGDDMDEYDDEPADTTGANPLSFLQNNPMFEQLRQRLVSEPAFFQTFMSQLQQTQPQLHQAISQNPQAFLQLLLGGGAGAGADAEHDPPGTIRVTVEEKAAIERLAGLGFPKHRAIEAYLACDKNEEWAANYLFENGNMDDNYEEQLVQDESSIDAFPPGLGVGQSPQPDIQNPPAAQNPPAPHNPGESSDNMDVDKPADKNESDDEEGGSSL